MKTAYFVRHAKSSWSNPMLPDNRRPLNTRGKRDAPLMAQMMVLKESYPDQLVSSPAKRAYATAKHFRKAFDLTKKKLSLDPRLYLASAHTMLALLAELPADTDVVYMFGHNPGMTDLANLFSDRYIENVPTCAIVKLQSTVADWSDFGTSNTRLAAFYYPKLFDLS